MKTLLRPTPLPKTARKAIIHKTMQPEIELLLCCARTRLESGMVDRIQQLLALELDWKFLIFLATQHRVLPLLFHNLKRVAPDQVPLDVFDHLQTFFNRHTFRNLNQTAEAIRLITLFKQNQIPAIPFKGPTLALNIYNNLALRQFDDLDILVAPSNFLQARELLIKQGGYQSPTPSYFFSVEEELSHLQSVCECSLVHPTQKTIIDLHQYLTGDNFLTYPFSFEELWQRSSIVPHNRQLLTLNLEDLLLYLCAHGAKSLWERLVWICDIAELIQAVPTIDWETLFKKAQTTKTDRMLRLGLQLAYQVLGTELPPAIAQRIDADVEVKSLSKQVYERILSGECGLNEKLNLEKMTFQFRVMANSREKVRYALRCLRRHGLTPIRRSFVPTKNDRLAVQLPDHLYFLYYLIRPFRLLSRAIADLVGCVAAKQMHH